MTTRSAWAQEEDQNASQGAIYNVPQQSQEQVQGLKKVPSRGNGRNWMPRQAQRLMGEQLATPAGSDSIPLVGRYAEGPTRAVDTQDDLIYFGTGEYLTIADISDPANPVEEGRVLLPAQARDVKVTGNYAYVAAALGGLRIVDVSEPTDPQIVAGFYTPSILGGNEVSDTAVAGSYLYYTSGYAGVFIIDISDPTAPEFKSRLLDNKTEAYAHGVAVANGYAYVTAGDQIYSDNGGGLRVVDISDPSAPEEVASLDTGTYMQGRSTEIIIKEAQVFVSGGFDGLRIIDISTPANPQEVGSFNPSGLGEVRGFDVNENHAYVRDRIVDISDPTNPQQAAAFGTESKDVSVSGNHAYATTGTGGLKVINVSDPADPENAGSFSADDFIHHITFSGDYAYAASGNKVEQSGGGLKIIDVSDPEDPQESSFLPIESIIGEIAFSDDYVYTGGKVISASDPENPSIASSAYTGSRGVETSGNFYYYVSTGNLIVIDISDPTDPEKVSQITIEEGIVQKNGSVAVYGDYVYAAEDESEIHIVDISSPYNPEIINTISYAGESVEDMEISGGYLYFSDRFTGVFTYEISNPESPSEVSKILPLNFNNINGVDISGGYAYLADGYGGIRVVDVSDPANPQTVTVSERTYTSTRGVAVREGHVFVQSTYNPIFKQKGGIYVFESMEERSTSPPTITGVDPDSIIGSEESQTLVVEGTNYRPESSVKLRNKESGEVLPDQEVAEQTDTSLTINYVFGKEPVKWSVEVINPGANNSGEFEFEVLAPGTGETPAPPTDLTVSTESEAIQLAWDPSTSDYVEETLLYRSTSASEEDATILDTIKGDATSYTDTAIEAGTRYYYRLRARNAAGNISPFSSAASTFFKPTTITYDVSRDFGGADETTDYRLVALPGQISRPFSEVVSGEAGTEWQAFWDDGSAENYLVKYDGSSSFTFRPGRGFWMLKKSNWSVSQSVETVSLNDQGKTSIPLHEGWNIIANPFGEHVSWSRVGEQYSDSLRTLWRFDGSFVQADTFRSARIGEAFYFLNDTGLDSLRVPYPGASTSSAESKEKGTLLAITARPEGSEGPTSIVEIGFAEKAAEGLDRLDQPAPPGRFSSVSLRLKASGTSTRQRWLAIEQRPPVAGPDEGHTFQLLLQSEIEGPVQVTASGLDATKSAEVRLLRPSTGRSHDLANEKSVTLGEADSTALRLAVGSGAYVRKQEEEIVPDEVTIISYPNPMREQATLEYTLPEAGQVRLTIYDMLGRRVATLEKGSKKAGRYRVSLERTDLSSGVYFGRLKVGDQTRTHKITVVR